MPRMLRYDDRIISYRNGLYRKGLILPHRIVPHVPCRVQGADRGGEEGGGGRAAGGGASEVRNRYGDAAGGGRYTVHCCSFSFRNFARDITARPVSVSETQFYISYSITTKEGAGMKTSHAMHTWFFFVCLLTEHSMPASTFFCNRKMPFLRNTCVQRAVLYS